MALDTTAVLAQIDAVLQEANDSGGSRIKSTVTRRNTIIDWNHQEVSTCVTLLFSCIQRLAPPGSDYVVEAARVRSLAEGAVPGQYHLLVGILKAMRADFKAGRLQSVSELIHGELFADFLEMAQHLLDEGYKDPAAVVGGAALEAHLRQLSAKHGVAVSSPDGSARKASSLNADLAKTSPPALTKLDEKQVTAWLDLRNKAAHGKFAEYTKEQVALMLQGIRDMLIRIPA